MNSFKRGFTFIELLVTVTMIAIIVAISLPTYNTFSEEKKLEDGASKLIDVLTLAQKKANSGDLAGATCDQSAGESFGGYQIVSTPTTVTMNVYCKPRAITVNTFSFQSNITITATYTGSATALVFTQLSRSVDGAPVTYKVKNSALNPAKCINVTVSLPGVIDSGAKYTVGC